MRSVADEVVEFFAPEGYVGLLCPNPFRLYFIRRLVKQYTDQRDGKLWSSALKTECKFVRLSNFNAWELINERGPSDGVSLTDAAGNSIKWPMLPVAIVEVVKRRYTYEKYTLLEQLY